MNYFDGDPIAQEIKDAIDGLNEDHRAELVALTWLGRGDFTAGEWCDALRMARERRTNPTSEYLLGTPMLGDYLEEGLVALGYNVEDLEPDTAWSPPLPRPRRRIINRPMSRKPGLKPSLIALGRFRGAGR